MKVLLHICCGPCAVSPVRFLKEEGFDVEGFFYNPNIHPYEEYWNRRKAAETASEKCGITTVFPAYEMEPFLKTLIGLDDRKQQHTFCWRHRLERTAREAGARGIPAFTTTLLASPYQDIEEIARIGEEIARSLGKTFLKRNFRKGFAEGHKISKEWQLYHQMYCGCLFSEKESLEQRRRKQGLEP